ncbi:MAG: ATP-dependent RecD-like DNA helicase [Armatimonadetes bacterium]|nr:ATP-dependent RecD-like DNA helicase [Armatimonadota bacterium]
MRRFDSGWCIANVTPEEESRDRSSFADSDLVLVGTLPAVTEGMQVRVRAKRTVHEKYGVQYKVVELVSSGYSTLEGIQKYLAGPDFEDVGEVTATAIVAHFGDKTIEILDIDPGRVMEVPGASPARLRRVAEGWLKARREHRELLELIKLGVSPVIGHRILKHFRDKDILKILAEDPYCLTEVRGIGFQKADEIAMRYGRILPDSPRRAEAAVSFVLDESTHQGHCYMDTPRIVNMVDDLIGASSDRVVAAIKSLAAMGRVVVEGTSVYSAEMHNAEEEVCNELSQLLSYAQGKQHYQDASGLKSELQTLGLGTEFEFDALQLQAIMTALNQRVCVITGGPGTGKTTITKAVVELLSHHGYQVSLCSPTGRAAKRLSESSGRPAVTIHRLLGVRDGGFFHNTANPLVGDVFIVDEFSMVDIRLFRDLLRALEPDDRLVLVGDADQLPSVGPGNVLRDVISSEAVPVVRLMHVFRQESGNTIVNVAHQILKGEVPELPTPKAARGRNCMMVDVGDDQEVLQSFIVHLVTQEVPKLKDSKGRPYSERDIQILTPRRTGAYSVDEMNPWLQEALNPGGPGVEQIKDSGRTLRVGDRVMQVQNNYTIGDNGVFNGDIGYIVSVQMTADGPNVGVKFADIANVVTYSDESLGQIQHAWATTVHKSQGSEIPVVLLVLQKCHSIMLQRNLLYTGLTRAKRVCVVIGAAEALARAVANNKEIKRNTNLSSRLKRASSQ